VPVCQLYIAYRPFFKKGLLQKKRPQPRNLFYSSFKVALLLQTNLDNDSEIIYFYRYDHLAQILTKVLDERPENVADTFEDISKEHKRSKFQSDVDTVQDRVDKSTEVALAEIQEKLFSVSINEESI